MNIIDHLSLGVSSIDKATSFYDGLLETLGVGCLAVTDTFAAYGDGSVQFLVMKPEDGKSFSVGNGTHICFIAPSQESVDSFHKYAKNNGGICEGMPGLRTNYPIPGIYTAFIRDPFGNKLEAIFNGFNSK